MTSAVPGRRERPVRVETERAFSAAEECTGQAKLRAIRVPVNRSPAWQALEDQMLSKSGMIVDRTATRF